MAVLAPTAAPPAGGTPATTAAQTLNPFTRASKRLTEPFYDNSVLLTASAQTLQQIDVPATGYLRHVVLDVDVSGTAAATYAADAPWNVLESVQLADVNGQPIVQLSGYDLMVANLTGGYVQHGDPTDYPGFASAATGFHYTLRIPVEIVQRNALGALANLNAAMTYKVKITLAPNTSVYTANPANALIRIVATVESWSNPLGSDIHGSPNTTTPPALGTTQNWSEYVRGTVVGQNTIRLPRVGNTIRNLVFINRDVNGARTDTGIPTELALMLDGNQWKRNAFTYEIQRMYELYGYGTAERPAGVWVLPLTDDFDGTPGEEIGDYWLTTSGATRLELTGVFTAVGSLTVMTNDILAWAGSPTSGQGV